MKASLLFLLFVLVCDGRHEQDLIYTSIGVIDPNPYIDTKNVYSKPEAHSRKRRSTAFTSSQEQAILDKHNELRSGVSPEAADMKFMVWDEDLATLAQEWSEECIWDHGTPESDTVSIFDPYGQNLWLGSGTADNQPDGIGATQAWYNEVSMYTYDTRACTGVCGHYTQVVWAESYALGCGIHFCSVTSTGNTNVWIMTCHYGPAGNYPWHPYISGPSCTKCSSGSGECYNNQCRLCSDHDEECDCRHQCQNCGAVNATCYCECQPYFVGVDCSEPCEDTNSYCNNGWYAAQCSGFDYVREGCPSMCGLCTTLPDDFECATNITTPTNRVTTQKITTPTSTVTTQKITTITSTETQSGCVYSCQNGGTLNENTCNCACQSGYQGDVCEENQEQVENGVKITIETSISDWDNIATAFLQAVEDAIDDYCNVDSNFQLCCPNSGNKNGTGTLNYLETDDVNVADGYPKDVNSDSFEIMIYVTPKENNDLCAAGTTEARRRRSIITYLQERMKRSIVVVYFDQDVLLQVIISSQENISVAIGVSIGNIEKGELIMEEKEEEDGGLASGVIAIIVVVAILLIIIVLAGVIYVIAKDTKNKKRVGSAEGNAING